MKLFMSSFLVGVLFAFGLALASMTQPQKIIAFLDVFGRWDPSLALVMVGALIVHATLYRLIIRRNSPVIADRFAIPEKRPIDSKLFFGAVIFGVGWGLGGFCPAPALVSLASLSIEPFVFVLSMLIGMFIFGLLEKNQRGARS